MRNRSHVPRFKRVVPARSRPPDLIWRGWLWRYRPQIRFACGVLGIFGAVSAVLCTLTPDGDFGTHVWLPAVLRLWLNGHGEVRNIPAYFFLSVPVLIAFSRRHSFVALALLFAGAASIELVQILIPDRTFDVIDIILSWLGIVIAQMAVETLRDNLLQPPRTRRISR